MARNSSNADKRLRLLQGWSLQARKGNDSNMFQETHLNQSNSYDVIQCDDYFSITTRAISVQ